MWKTGYVHSGDNYRITQGKRGEMDFMMSRSELVKFAACPAKWVTGAEEPKSKSIDFGSLVDCLATCPDKLNERFAIEPLTYMTKGMKCNICGSITDAKKCSKCKTDRVEVDVEKPFASQSATCQEWTDAQKKSGKHVVSSYMFDSANNAYKILAQDKSAAEIIVCSLKQVLIQGEWQDHDTGLVIPISGLIDFLPDNRNQTWGRSLVDLKTARNGNPANWARVVDDSGYDVQAAMYLDIYNKYIPESRTDFIHIVQENMPPYHVVTPCMAMSNEFIEWGRMKYQTALALYARCLATNEWPSYRQVGIPFGSTQIISPDGLWSYRSNAGMPEFKMPEPKVEQQSDDTIP